MAMLQYPPFGTFIFNSVLLKLIETALILLAMHKDVHQDDLNCQLVLPNMH